MWQWQPKKLLLVVPLDSWSSALPGWWRLSASLGDLCVYLTHYYQCNVIILIGLPEHVRYREKEDNLSCKHSFIADPDSMQPSWIFHTDFSVESSRHSTEIAEPQSRCSQITDAAFMVQSELSIGLHTPKCFNSSVPAQRLDPPTKLTNSEQKAECHKERSKKIFEKILILDCWWHFCKSSLLSEYFL